MFVPDFFCWTRFGTEAGETIAQILARKDRERISNGGVFLWGIGNAIGPSIRELLAREKNPEAFFSPIRSHPRQEDVSPSAVVQWKMGRTLDGDLVSLPASSHVTSGVNSTSTNRKRYALVCASMDPLVQGWHGELQFEQLTNIRSGRAIGASQVTTVVRLNRETRAGDGKRYRIALRAKLVAPYFVELAAPEAVKPERSLSLHFS